ncbi:MAG: transglutaminase family protein, partial [Hydrogenophaga sp.]
MADNKTIPIKPINARSAHITEGKSRAPNRSMYYAMGYQQDEATPLRPQAALLNKVLERRRGQPLALGLITLELARRLEIPMVG